MAIIGPISPYCYETQQSGVEFPKTLNRQERRRETGDYHTTVSRSPARDGKMGRFRAEGPTSPVHVEKGQTAGLFLFQHTKQ
ncbi:MAG: hypothetical protein DSY81_11725 [Bacillota bacterium]|nr:MAG: hypothetical protein DSY81_11725 [Bacillota bacterium]